MTLIDKKIYSSILFHIKNKKKITIRSVAKYANIDRANIYHKLNNLVS